MMRLARAAIVLLFLLSGCSTPVTPVQLTPTGFAQPSQTFSPPPRKTATATQTRVLERKTIPTATMQPTATSTPIGNLPIRAMRVDEGYDAAGRAKLSDLEARMRQAGINLVAVGAGRPEWTYFRWTNHRERWSSEVRDSGMDFLKEDTARFGAWAQVNAVVDVYAPQYIKDHPEKAALSWLNKPSPYLVNTTELVDGAYGQIVLDMVEAIAANYAVDSISITEMMYYTEGYSDADKAAFTAATGRKDWPRLANGLVNIDHPAVGAWRSQELARFVGKARAIAAKYGKALYVDVGVSWKAPGNLGQEMGTRYDQMLRAADKIIVWDYAGLENASPDFSEALARVLVPLGTERVILSIGLWGQNTTVISAQYLDAVMKAAKRGGIQNLWITPSQLMTANHWQTIETNFPP